MKFEFDPNKTAFNREKHGIDFVQAQGKWADERLIDIVGTSSGEPRHLAVGLIGKRHWTAVSPQRGDSVRIISVRRSRKDEVKKWLDGQ